MYAELEKSLESPKSVFCMFLQNCPESVESLLNDCLVPDANHSTDDIGKVIFDFFLFCPEDSESSEVATIDLVIATGKNKLIEHPLFETFIRLKWLKIWKLYTVTFLLSIVHMSALVGYSLFNYSHMFEFVNPVWKNWIFWVIFLISNVMITLLQLVKIHGIFFWRCYNKSKQTKHSLSSWRERQERFYPLLDSISPIIGYLELSFTCKELSVFLILYSSWQCMRGLTMFPRIGKNVFITRKVTKTICEFFLAYISEILAFTLAFHILLPGTNIFR